MTKKIFLPILASAFFTLNINELMAIGERDIDENHGHFISTSKKRTSFKSISSDNKSKYEIADEKFKSGLRSYHRKDYDDAFELFMEAAEQGHVTAQYSVGALYEYGLGTKNSFKEAGKWYTVAASQGNEDAKIGIERVVKKASSSIYCFFFGADLPQVTVLPVVF